ncbi:MAG TPA: ChaN family lipoprotein [Polyangiaceae bacterium]|nr:ChaN family lipoprotein [Polyangiaceae bacterium]
MATTPETSVARWFWLLAPIVSACAAQTPARPIGYDLNVDVPEVVRPAAPSRQTVPFDVVARAQAPIRAVRLRDAEELSAAALARELLTADAVCAGEEHGTAAHHYAELWLLDQLLAFAPARGLELGVGLEMFQRPFQGALSLYQQGKSDEDELVQASEYASRWGYAFDFYRPLLERARDRSVPLVALNAPRELTRQVAKAGLDGLDDSWQRRLPELDLDHAEHRADFGRRMQQHPGLTAERWENYYSAQVVWDESMAAAANEWLTAHAPIRRILIVAGATHCQRFAIPERLTRRSGRPVAAVAITTSMPTSGALGAYDYAVVVDAAPKP